MSTTPAVNPDGADRASPGPSLISSYFTAKALSILALTALGLSLGLFALGIWRPQYFENDPMARFILCISVATLLSVFFSVFYPKELEVALPQSVGLTLKLVGPSALWFVVFYLLLQWMPSGPAGYIFRPQVNGQIAHMWYNPKTTVSVPGDADFVYHLIPEEDRHLYGIYVEFNGSATSYKAKLSHPPFKPIDVVFSRGKKTFDVDALPDAKENS